MTSSGERTADVPQQHLDVELVGLQTFTVATQVGSSAAAVANLDNQPHLVVGDGRLTVPMIDVFSIGDSGQCGERVVECPLPNGDHHRPRGGRVPPRAAAPDHRRPGEASAVR